MTDMKKSNDTGVEVFWAPSQLLALPNLKKLKQENLPKNKAKLYQSRLMFYIGDKQ